MSLLDNLTIAASAATVVERITEIVKPIYLKAKTKLMKKDYTECTKAEKVVITILLGIIICIVLQIGIDIPSVNEPAIIQQLIAGLISSLGSNFLHMLLSILTAMKDTAESRVSSIYRDNNARNKS